MLESGRNAELKLWVLMTSYGALPTRRLTSCCFRHSCEQHRIRTVMSVTILIAEDDFLIREGLLRPLLEPHFTIVGAVEDGLEAVKAASEYKPDVVLLDISLPRVRGFEAARQILAARPDCKVLLVSNYADCTYPDAAREMGAGGYVLKSRVATELLPAIQTALTGDFFRSSF